MFVCFFLCFPPFFLTHVYLVIFLGDVVWEGQVDRSFSHRSLVQGGKQTRLLMDIFDLHIKWSGSKVNACLEPALAPRIQWRFSLCLVNDGGGEGRDVSHQFRRDS
jgi:hypothetical protein